MLTPEQLRGNARDNLTAARTVLSASPRNAAYLAGYAIEFVLKSRYCTLRKWSRFPGSVQELKAWNERDGVEMKDKLFVHDLDTLLRLSNDVHLKTSTFRHINWKQACDWSEQIRYEPSDSISLEEAQGLIAEAEKVVEHVCLVEVLQILRTLEIEVSFQYGPFNCFALVVHPQTQKWLLLAAWYAPDAILWQARAEELNKCVDERLDSDLRALVSEVVFPDAELPMLQGLYVMVGSICRGIIHSAGSIFASNSVQGYPQMLDGYLITAGRWTQESMQKAWNEAPALRQGETAEGGKAEV